MAERTKKERKASARKAARTRKQNEKTSEEAKILSAKKRKRNMTVKKKGFMSDLFTPAAAKGAVRIIANAALGGGIAVVADEILVNELKINEKGVPIWLLAISGATAMMGKPNIAAGIAGYSVGVLAKRFWKRKTTETTMQDDMLYLQDNAYVNNLEALPLVLDSNGVAMAENNMYLQEDDYQVGYAPDFSGLNY